MEFMFETMMNEATRVQEVLHSELERERELVAELLHDVEVQNREQADSELLRQQADSELLKERMTNQDLEASLAKLKEDMEVLQKTANAEKAEVVALNRDKSLLLLCIATAEGAKRRRVE